MQMTYVDIAEIKKRNIKIFKSLSDEYILDRLSCLSKEVEEYCHTKFAPTEDIQKSDLSSSLKTRKQPLLSVDQITINGAIKTEDVDYYVYPEQSLIEIENPAQYDRKKRTVTIRYLYGYEEVAQTVKDVIIELLQYEEEIKEIGILMESESWEDHNYNKSKKTKETILARLDKYCITEEDMQLQNANTNVRVMLL